MMTLNNNEKDFQEKLPGKTSKGYRNAGNRA